MMKYLTMILIIINVMLMVVLCRSCHEDKPCADNMIVSHDTLIKYKMPIDTALHVMHKGIAGAKIEVRKSGNAYVKNHMPYTDTSSSAMLCTDTLIYKDSVYKTGLFRAVICDTVTANRIIGRSLAYADLKPIEIREIHTTKTILQRPKMMQLSLGISTMVGADRGRPQINWDAGPSALLNMMNRAQIAYTYYPRNNMHQAGVWISITPP